MWKPSPPPPDDPPNTTKLADLRRRPARYGDQALRKRREELRRTLAMQRLPSDPHLSLFETELGELWATGRITEQEYCELCAEDVRLREEASA